MTAKEYKDIVLSLAEFRPALRIFITKKLDCPDSAEDVLQSIAEKLLRKRPKDSVENHRAYLYQMAKNEVINHCRSKEARSRYENQSANEQESAVAATAEDEAQARQVLDNLSKSLNELPVLTRQIFVMYRIEGRKQKDIAKNLESIYLPLRNASLLQ
ncbi:MAG: sigma-70 family RNA polymerase sigma factor [Cellvibrionaceae bacterium]|nr:sigma-70 family RNA polymerase sigma factor [Cellvibrionaceae bacterium]